MSMNAPQDYNQYYDANRINQANQMANQAYSESKAKNEAEQVALDKAKFAWQQTMDQATLTGQYQGAPTQAALQYGATAFGTWGAPQQGQQTLAGNQQAWQQAYQNAQAYGQYYAPGTAPTQGQQTMAQNQQQWAQNYQAQQQALAAQNQYQQQAMGYLNLLQQLRGPADWAKYQQVLGSTPQGMKDLTAAAMGQYIPGGGATTGVNPQAASLQTMQGQVAGTGTPQEAAGGGTNTMGNMPAPNQIAPQAWNNLAPSQQQMMLGAYENQGWYKPDVEKLFSQSLPKYASNAPQAGTWRLQ